MLIPTNERIKIYTKLFSDGVLVAKKDFSGMHSYIPGAKNIWVWHCMRSLESRGYGKIQFSWQTNYFFLTNEGIEYLRNYLHLPDEIVPNTLKKGSNERERERDSRPERPGRGGDRDGGRPGGRGRGGFGGSRGGFDKKAGAPAAGQIGFNK